MKLPEFSVLILGICLAACNSDCSERNEFYKSKGDFDLRRIPLIRPYVIVDTRTDYWLVDYFYFDKNKPWNNRQRVDRFTIVDSVIVIECNDCVYDGEEEKGVYTVVIPKNKFEKTFTNRKDYQGFLIKNNIKPKEMYRPTDTYLSWEKGAHLPWAAIKLSYEDK